VGKGSIRNVLAGESDFCQIGLAETAVVAALRQGFCKPELAEIRSPDCAGLVDPLPIY